MDTIDRLLDAISAGDIGDELFADEATFDGTVPNWRFPVRGGPAIRDQYATWYRVPAQMKEVRRHPTPDGEVVEFSLEWEQDGAPVAARQVHVLRLDEHTGRIASAHVWCGGVFTASALAEMETAARRNGHVD